MFKKIKSTTIFCNKWVTIFKDKIKFPNGKLGDYTFIQRSDGVSVAILNKKNQILLIKQYRYPIKNYEWNIPGGAADSDHLKQEAIREIQEETGLKLTKIEKIAQFYPLSSCSTEKYHVYLSKINQNSSKKQFIESNKAQQNESIKEKSFFPIEKALQMIDDGQITDANTANIIQLIARKLKKQSI